MKLKYKLPTHLELSHIEVDLQRLRAAADKLAHRYTDVMTANPALCQNHKSLVESVYSNFDQINLTELNGEMMPFTSNIRERLHRKEERLYNKPTADYTGSYFEEIVRQFRAPAMRVRITRLKPKTEIPFHIDYDPSYATRIIVPIYSDESVVNEFKVRNETLSCYLKPGKAYFLNTGFAHAVFNHGDRSRVALMFSLDGLQDLNLL